jgi:Tol biopolymer transport system component
MLNSGSRLGHFTIQSPLGAGGMGEVWRAHDEHLDREVAIKVLPAEVAGDPDRLARFEREARALAKLSHPNIVGIFEFGTDQGITYAVTELLEGETLEERLRQGALPWRKAVEIGAAIADGLAAAHAQGIVHRDLKPANVFLTEGGRVRVLDFGLAKVEEKPLAELDTMTSPAPGTLAGTVLGTVGYMAPEQVRGQAADARSDLFALGCVLYEMLSGGPAFQRDSSVETMTAILKEEPPDLAALKPDLPAWLAVLVRHCLEKRPEDRFQSARDLAFDLQTAAGASTAAMTPPPALRPALRRRWAMPVAGVVLLTAVGGAAYLTGRALERRRAPLLPTFRQMTFRPQTIFSAAFAPDGETLVFDAAREGIVPELYILRPEYPEPQPLGLPHTHLLAISSQGELAVITNATIVGWRSCVGTLARVPLGGTGPRAVAEQVFDADWSPDGSELAIIRAGAKDRLEYPLGTVLYESSGSLSHVRVSPRGDRVALFEHPSHFDDRGSIITVDRKRKRAVLGGEYSSLEGLAWSPAGDEVLFTGAKTGGYGSYAAFGVDLAGRSRVVLSSAGGMSLQDVSRSGRWLVTRDERAIGIRGRAPGATSERELSFLDGSWGPVLSRDGRTVLFTEISVPLGGNYSFYMRGTDGSPVVRLGEGMVCDISPDSRWILAVTQEPQEVAIYPVGSGEKRVLQRGALVGYRSARWFPDGKRVLVCGNEEGEGPRCYVQDVGGGAPRPVTAEGERGLVSPDGRRVVVWGAGSALAVYGLDGSGREVIPGTSDNDAPVRWGADGRSLIVMPFSGSQGHLERVDLVSGKREVVREFETFDRAGVLSVGGGSVADDPAVYAYQYFRMRSTLFLVEGAR